MHGIMKTKDNGDVKATVQRWPNGAVRSGGDLDQTDVGINSQEVNLICFEQQEHYLNGNLVDFNERQIQKISTSGCQTDPVTCSACDLIQVAVLKQTSANRKAMLAPVFRFTDVSTMAETDPTWTLLLRYKDPRRARKNKNRREKLELL